MRISRSAIGLLMLVAACAQAPAPRIQALAASPAEPPLPPPIDVEGGPAKPTLPAPSIDVDGEAVRLRAALGREVPHLIVDPPAAERRWIERSRTAVADGTESIDRPQLLVVVDRNPRVQQMRIVVARPDANWRDLGGTRVSTGQTGRFDYYLTPTGVFLHTDAILDWRAEGTFNENHIRGLGLKGMRVWDFGWQTAAKGWTEEEGQIRLLMHATDPANLERRLGRPASKGCVRIPAAMNRFLDRHGVLDADYERVAQNDPGFAALLSADHTPTPLAGNMLVIIDSSETRRPGA
jgi:lipoprotein-anchoring transpeptidase ErfK/SrfK